MPAGVPSRKPSTLELVDGAAGTQELRCTNCNIPQQLSVLLLSVQKNNVYQKDVELCVDSVPGLG
jgi:hypothetical protein